MKRRDNTNIISNPQAEALPTSISANDLGKAMAQLDTTSVPPHKRRKAIMEHFYSIMADSIQDQELSTQLRASGVLHRGNIKTLL